MKEEKKSKRKAYICAELDDASLWKPIAQKVSGVVEEFRGEVTVSGYLCEYFTIEAVFPHRKLKALEEAVKHALAGLPVRNLAVWPTDPFKLRKRLSAFELRTSDAPVPSVVSTADYN